jgi:AcrR family transcriptional regulator
MRAGLSFESDTLTIVDDVKTRRYDNTRRQERTRLTRRRVIDAARALFLERGYAATSMEAISLAADVPQATLYRLFPSKSALLKEVVDITAVGDDEPIALHERPEVLALRDEPDPTQYLAGFAHVARVVHERIEPVRRMLHSAAPVDADAAAMLAAIHQQRYTGQGIVARALLDRGALRHGLTEDEAHDIIYALMSPELRNVLMGERGWSADRYEGWLAATLRDTLLEPTPATPGTQRRPSEQPH